LKSPLPERQFARNSQGYAFLFLKISKFSGGSVSVFSNSKISRWGPAMKIYSFHRRRKVLVRVIPDGQLYRIEWPDIGLSDLVKVRRPTGQ
jgi:hypothetical protein